MMHDAIRGDVLSALVARSQDELDTAATDLADHAATLREDLARAADAGLGDAVGGRSRPSPPTWTPTSPPRPTWCPPPAATPPRRRTATRLGQVFSTLEESWPSVADAIPTPAGGGPGRDHGVPGPGAGRPRGTAVVATVLLVGLAGR